MNFFMKKIFYLIITSIALQSMHAQSMEQLLNFANKNKYIFAAALAIASTSYYALTKKYTKNLHWDWKNIDPTIIDGRPVYQFFKEHQQKIARLEEPQSIAKQNEWLWGAGTSAHQVESGNTNTQWNLLEADQDERGNWVAPLINGKPALLDKKIVEPVGIGCDTQNHEDEDIQNMKDFGLNTYRFSIAWEKIYPEEHRIDHKELARYKNFCQKLVKNGIKPIVTLYHYAEPQWFYNKGGFEKEENLSYFVNFCQVVYKELHPYVHLWLTFNSPEGIALQGWMTGSKPPAKRDKKLAVQVLYNILEAHVRVYQRLKASRDGKKSRIGILKNVFQLDPWNTFNPADQLFCKIGNKLQNDLVYDFLTKGTFSIYLPVWFAKTNEYIKNGGKCLDFIGLNYYCHNYIKNGKTVAEPNPELETPTNNERYPIYGEGLYRAIEELSQKIAKPLGIPIYITENGVATDNDKQGNELRTLHNQRYLYAMARAIQDGHDVRGYVHWSLMDNYEWGVYRKFYGLYHVDRSTPELKRTLKEGAKYYQSVVKGEPYAIQDQPDKEFVWPLGASALEMVESL